MNIKLITGIGNANKKLLNTRHNVGTWVIKKFLHEKNIKEIKLGKIYEININHKNIYLYIPNTYINNSGKHIFIIKKELKLQNKEILIIHDDIDLNPGRVKLKQGIGSICTHNGIKDIAKNIKGKINFYRLRIGIGKPCDKQHIKKYVLSKPNKTDKNNILKVIKKIIFCIKFWISQNNLNKVINILHTKNNI